MASVNVDKMSLKDLLDLQVKVGNAIVKAKDREKAELRSKIDQLTHNAGVSVAELYNLGRGRGAAKGSKVAVKYANPQNKAETWTGRGRQPRWLAAKLAKGGKLDDFKI
jgi:DNA-binding protein H-NS